MSDQIEPIDQLYEDYRTVASDRIACGHWTADDRTEVKKLIKAAIDAGPSDAGLLRCWSDWMASEAEAIRRWQFHVRDVEARMRALAKAEREELERKAV